ncbi:PTS transporter subunit EIIC [Collinsella intestinalis]|uniref:PTS transporter subunit EIIC n=1 Tax=Collinsella intestinalis TaxID=147207 RepID=UPI00195A41F8|nr:PTS transporter subunit EIIC [Collinsella intestinalis]MBM6683058.1 PTS transporter subunit EIIC [Collinsella intestinalis]
MAKDYSQLAKDVVAAVGGGENIVSVTNCMTRLRFVLKDDSIPNEEEVKAVPGVKGVMNQGGQYQVIIGTHVGNVTPLVREVAGITAEDDGAVKIDKVGQGSLFDRFFKVISGCIMPMIGPMIAGGIIKGILTLCTTFGVLATTDGAYQLWYAAADAVLYFMPIIVGFSAGKVFGCNPYVTAAIGAAFVYPNLVSAVSVEGGISFFGLPVAAASYSNTLFPVLLASFFASLVEKGAKKVIPEMVQLMLVPVVVLAVTVPVAWLAIGPVMNMLSSAISSFVMWLFEVAPVLAGVVLGAFWQVVVLLGLHSAMIPIIINNVTTLGADPLNAVLGLTVWALAGVSLGYALKMRDPEKRAEGITDMTTCLFGVTEPTIYSICLPQFKCFMAAWVGGGIAGGILAALGGKCFSMAGDGLFRIPAMINPEGIDISFYGFIVTMLIAFVVSAILSFVLTDRDK